MKIVVFVKYVPDVDSDRKIEDGRIVRGEDDVLNELDEYAIEEAVSLVEDHGGEVVAVTMGPGEADEAVFRALQMGADRGIRVDDENLGGADALGTAEVLASLAKQEEPDLVLAGMGTLDGMTSLVPAAVAAHLGWPLLDIAEKVSVQPDPLKVTIERHTDGYTQTLSALAPVVVSVTDQVNEPRYPSFKTMRAARAKPLDEVASPLPEGASITRLEVVSATPKQKAEGRVVNDMGDAGAQLAAFLLEQVEK